MSPSFLTVTLIGKVFGHSGMILYGWNSSSWVMEDGFSLGMICDILEDWCTTKERRKKSIKWELILVPPRKQFSFRSSAPLNLFVARVPEGDIRSIQENLYIKYLVLRKRPRVHMHLKLPTTFAPVNTPSQVEFPSSLYSCCQPKLNCSIKLLKTRVEGTN